MGQSQIERGRRWTESKLVSTLRKRYFETHRGQVKSMPKNLEFLWFLCTVSPVIVLTLRTRVARHKARESEIAWKIAERYIFRAASDADAEPDPSGTSPLSMESRD